MFLNFSNVLSNYFNLIKKNTFYLRSCLYYSVFSDTYFTPNLGYLQDIYNYYVLHFILLIFYVGHKTILKQRSSKYKINKYKVKLNNNCKFLEDTPNWGETRIEKDRIIQKGS